MSQVGYCTGIDLYKLEYCEGIDVVNSIAPIAPLILPTETSHTHCTHYTVRIITYIALILAYCIAHISHLLHYCTKHITQLLHVLHSRIITCIARIAYCIAHIAL